MLSDFHLLREVEQQSPFTGIDSSAIFDRQATSSIFYGQINIKSGVFPLFKIDNSIVRFGLFLFFSHKTPSWCYGSNGVELLIQISIDGVNKKLKEENRFISQN